MLLAVSGLINYTLVRFHSQYLDRSIDLSVTPCSRLENFIQSYLLACLIREGGG